MPATVIDELVVELGLDPAKFTKGQRAALDAFKKTREEVDKGGKEIDAHGAKVSQFFSILKREAIGALGIFVGGRGVKEFVGFLTNLDASIGRVSKTLNMNVKEVSAWTGMFEQLGGSGESAVSALSGLSQAMNQFMLTGQGPFLGLFSQLKLSLFDDSGKMKTPDKMLLEIADAIYQINKSDPARAAATLSMVPGMNQDSINVMINGRQTMERLLETARQAGGTTKESAEAAAEYQKNMANLERTAVSTSRTFANLFLPSLTKSLEAFQKLIDAANKWRGGLLITATGSALSNVLNPGGALGTWIAKMALPEKGRVESSVPSDKRSVLYDSKHELASYIREAAIKRGIDPDVALAVSRSEGFKTYVGDKGTSFGPYQLHYKNNIPGLSNPGLGDKFTKQTGLHANDPSTTKQQIDFALDEAKKSGWGAWHGWKGLPYAGISGASMGAGSTPGATGGGGATSNSRTTNVGTVILNTKATDAQGIASDFKSALERESFAAKSNAGLQ